MSELADKLESVVELYAKRDAAADALKQIKAEVEQAEREAVDLLAASGLDQGVPVAGRSWRWQEAPQVSVLADRREEVFAAAESVGLSLTQLNTAALRAWLVEHGKEAGREPGESLAAGTPFEGLVSEYLPTKLYSTKRN
jgi:hypothetical protein